MRTVALVFALVLVACGDRCARGPMTSCWCPGDAIGQSTCDDDGLYGECVCPSARR